MRTLPWNMGVRTPKGGEYWVSRTYLFEKAAAVAEDHAEQVRNAAAGKP